MSGQRNSAGPHSRTYLSFPLINFLSLSKWIRRATVRRPLSQLKLCTKKLVFSRGLFDYKIELR